MKTYFMAILLAGTTFFFSCGDTTEKTEKTEQSAESYQCPMKCEGEKTYDKAGQCSICKMDLAKVEAGEENHEGHQH